MTEASVPKDRPSGRIRFALVTGFYSGLFPVASGTVGSAAACILILLLPEKGFLPWVLGCALASTAISIHLGPWAQRRFQKRDPSPFVLDEFAGAFLAVAHPAKPDAVILLLAFLLFRLFDIVKLFPGRAAERLPGGWGICLDDLIAGVYANVVLLALRSWLL